MTVTYNYIKKTKSQDKDEIIEEIEDNTQRLKVRQASAYKTQ